MVSAPVDPVSGWLSVTRPRGAVVAHLRLPARWGVSLPAAPAVAVHVLLEGEACLRAHERAWALGAGDVVMLRHGPAHELASHPSAPCRPLQEVLRGAGGGPVRLMCASFSGSRCPVTSVWAGMPDVLHLSAASLRAVPGAGALLALLAAEVEAPGHGSEPLVGSLLDALIVFALRAWAVEEGRAGGWWEGLDDPILGRALREIHANPAAPWTIASLARLCGVSRSVFAQRFADRLGEAPMAYVRRWRMALAARWLLDGDASVGAIAERVGYQSEFAFNRAFKQVMGEPPGRFRRSVTAAST